MHEAHGWALRDIQLAFSIFIATETWLTPIEGWIVDYLGPRRGPPIMIAFGAVLVGIAWIINAYATSLGMLYLGAAVSGTGAGAIYATCVGNAVKWFPDRRGLAVGMTAAGFGAGAALTVIPIRMMIEGLGYANTFFWFGIGQGVVLLLIAPVMRGPLEGEMPTVTAPKVQQTAASSTPDAGAEEPDLLVALRDADGDLGQRPDRHRPDRADRSGLRPFQGGFVPRRRRAVGGAGGRQRHERHGTAVLRLGVRQHRPRKHHGDRLHPGWVQLFAARLLRQQPMDLRDLLRADLLHLGRDLQPVPLDLHRSVRPKFATTNAMLLYTAKGTSAWLVPLANISKTSTGSWQSVFITASVVNFAVVLAAVFILKPARKRG